jgi:uncharacterized membrane protein SpoIIM required for sporulation
MAALYREVCTDLMRARALSLGLDLTSYLDALAARAHNTLYASKPRRLPEAMQMLWHDFPVALRRRLPYFVTATGLFCVPFFVGLFAAVGSKSFAFTVLPTEVLEEMAESYSSGFAEGRAGGTDAAMAGFYVYNNVGIAFRCFATGILFGVGSVFFLVYNGLAVGAIAGFVVSSGGGQHLLTFVSGHAPFELTAILIAGGAGLQMGYSLIDTKGLTRTSSLRAQASELVALVCGAAVMLAIAALIEAFWSPSSISAPAKWGVGIANLASVVMFLTLVGRGVKESRRS